SRKKFRETCQLMFNESLSEAEARLVVLLRRTELQPEKSEAVAKLRMEFLIELTDRAVANDKTSP
ncbi:MAG: hypothetical protein AAB036_03800, partial [Elusimicrobiota bacterium]